MKVRRLRWRFYKKQGGPRGIGNRCSDYCRGCLGCESYRFLSRYGRFPTFDEVSAVCDVLHGNEPMRGVTPEMWRAAREIAADLERMDGRIEQIKAEYGLEG